VHDLGREAALSRPSKRRTPSAKSSGSNSRQVSDSGHRRQGTREASSPAARALLWLDNSATTLLRCLYPSSEDTQSAPFDAQQVANAIVRAFDRFDPRR
jgi:hypothetical protein